MTHITPVKLSNRCNIAHIHTWKVVPIDSGVGLESFAFNPRDEGPYIDVSDGLESSNGSVLRVVWICFDVDQFRAIVYDSNRTRSLLLAGGVVPGASSRRARQRRSQRER